MANDKIKCPWCDRSFDLDQVEAADLWRERVVLAAGFGKACWPKVNEYLDAFRARRDGRLTLKRRCALLKDMLKLWESGEFMHDGKRWRVEKAGIMKALDVVNALDKYGFRDHNYLKKVMITGGAERLSAEGMSAREERTMDEKRQAGATEERRTLKEFQEARPDVAGLAGSVGKKI